MPQHKLDKGYRHEPDKFTAAHLTEQPSELVGAPRVEECPIQLECTVVTAHPFGSPVPHATAFLVTVLRAHVEDGLLISGTNYVDPMAWDPLIMKFCEFFGNGENVHASQLAQGWSMPHGLMFETLGRTPVEGVLSGT